MIIDDENLTDSQPYGGRAVSWSCLYITIFPELPWSAQNVYPQSVHLLVVSDPARFVGS